MAFQLDLMPVEDKLPDTPPPKTMVVRYGYLKEIGEFPSDLTSKVGCGTKLVVRTDRGVEIAEMLTTTCGNGGCNKSITRDKLLSYIEESGGRDYPFSETGRVLRVATVQDLAEQAKLDEDHKKHLTMARELVVQHKLSMKIVDVEHVLGGERVLFYFISEHRVDFRNLVRDLAHSLHTRIEMRQVGARDEARLTADYEKCGQHCCCKQFLKVLTPISMRSAKVQKATLDPTKISGRCGRLMCCLRYEDETYEELRKKLPKRNTRVKVEKGDGWVIDGQILTQLVLVQLDDGTREAIPMEKILEFDRPKPLMADGRVMQTPNDRPPMGAAPLVPPPTRRGPGAPNAPGGPANSGPGINRDRPQPGTPVDGPDGDPRALSGPTGGDLNTGDPAPDDIAEMIADSMDDPRAAESSAPSGEAGAAPLPPKPQGQRPPGGPGPFPPRNPSNQGGGRPQQNRGPMPQKGGGQRPPQQRGPQGFRPPAPRGPMTGGRGGPLPPQQAQPPKDSITPPPAQGSIEKNEAPPQTPPPTDNAGPAENAPG